MPNIVIRHLSGTKANQVEEVPLQGFREVLIGREANAHIRFDADREDLVSRNHARIVRDPADPNGFLLTDLGSRNGTFINRQRIYGASRLQHGDRVQLGPAGPEFSFELDPAPAARPARLAESILPPPTREASIGIPPMSGPPMPPGTRPGSSDAPRPVGRQTVERLVGEVSTQMKGESRKTMWTAVIGILILGLAGAGYFLWNRQQQQVQQETARLERDKAELARREAKERLDKLTALIANSKGATPESRRLLEEERQTAAQALAEKVKEIAALTQKIKPPTPEKPVVVGASELSPEQIHSANAKTVILIEDTWQNTDTGTGSQLYLYHHRNDLGACPQVAKTEFLPM